MRIYKYDGCECKDSEDICSNTKYIVVHDKSIKKIKELYVDELNILKMYGKIILGKELTSNIIENWAKSKHYYKDHLTELSVSTTPIQVSAMKKILIEFDSSRKVDKDLRTGKDLLNLSYSLFKKGAKTFGFKKDCKESLRILIKSDDSLSKFTDRRVVTNTKTKFIELLQKVFHKMGTKYNPVRITSGFRTPDEQAKIMTELIGNGKDIAAYYTTAERSLPYLQALQILYDGAYLYRNVYPLGFQTLAETTDFTNLILKYIGFEEPILDIATTLNTIMIGRKFYNISTIRPIFYKNKIGYYDLLSKSMNSKIFWPSLHLEGLAFDLERNTSGSERKAYDLHPEDFRRDTDSPTNPHYHLTLR